jgi:hypothetical protein
MGALQAEVTNLAEKAGFLGQNNLNPLKKRRLVRCSGISFWTKIP